MTSSALRVSTPGEIAALVPHLVGFRPAESLVALSLHAPRRRIGLTLRADLRTGPALVGQVVEAMVRDGAAAVALLVHTEAPSSRAHPFVELVDDLEEALAARGVDVDEALLVRGESWWSYRCTRPCCPPGGTPVDADSPAVRATAAEQAYEGRAVLASRAARVAGLRAQPVLGTGLPRRLQAAARADLAERSCSDRAGTVREELARWRAALDAVEQQRAPEPAGAAELAAALHLVAVRDEVASWGLSRADALLVLLEQLCRVVVAPDDAPLCSVLAWVSYSRGNGAVALIALERALTTDPAYSLARLLLTAVDAAVPPARVREVLRAA